MDNIPGVPGVGPVGAFEQLERCTTEEQMFHNVRSAYIMAYPENWEEVLLEQGRLLWMVTEVDEEGKPVMWEMPDE